MRTKLIVVFILFAVRLHGQNWIGFGHGADNAVYHVLNDSVGNKLYLEGLFNNIDGDTARGIASWDGTNFSPMDVGVNYMIGSPAGAKGMCMYNGKLLVCGVPKLGQCIINQGIGIWNGSTWDTLAESLDPSGGVYNMIVNGTDLYASGIFSTAGSIAVNSIAKWNGIHWSNVGSGFPFHFSGLPYITSMKFFNGELYVAGSFDDSLGNQMDIAKFDGTNWKGVGIELVGVSQINCLEIYNNELYAAGMFTAADGNLDNAIMRYDGISWKPVGGGFLGGSYPQVTQLKVINNKLYAVGIFDTAGGIPAENIAKWDGTNWCGFGSSINNKILTIDWYNGDIYIGGGFNIIDSDTVNYFAKWIGGSYVDSCGNRTGINENLISEKQISIYPNPINSDITIEFENQTTQDVLIEVKNVLGQTVYSEEMKNAVGKQSKNIDVSIFLSGVYFVQLKTTRQSFSKKFIKQ